MDESRQPPETYESLAQLIDHQLLAPNFSEDDVAEGCRIAREYGVRSVIVRPCDVDSALRWMERSGVRLGSTVGYPDGSSSTAAKLYEGRDLLRRGVQELEITLSIGKMVSRQFQYVEMELLQMVKSCQEGGATLKVALGNRYLSSDLQIIALKICRRVEAPFLVADNRAEDIARLRPLMKDQIELKTSAQTLVEALEARSAGCTRLGTTAAAAILDAWKARLLEASLQ